MCNTSANISQNLLCQMNRLTLKAELDQFSLEGFHTRHPAIDLSSSTQTLCDQTCIAIQEAGFINAKEDL